MQLYNLLKHETWDNLKTGKWWIPTLETIWRAPAKGRHPAPSSSALHRSRSIWRCRHDLPGCTWLLWERSNGRKCVSLCSFAVRHISLYSLCPKWKKLALRVKLDRSKRNQPCAQTKSCKKIAISPLLCFINPSLTQSQQTNTDSFTKTPLHAVEPYFFSSPSFVQVVLFTTLLLSRTIVPWTLSNKERSR